MAYIDGFVIPVKTARKADYAELARFISGLYREHGAIRCIETWGEDVPLGERTSSPRALELAEDETVVFSWMEFPDKATRDAAHRAVWSNSSVEERMMNKDIIAGQRMIFGGFEMLLEVG